MRKMPVHRGLQAIVDWLEFTILKSNLEQVLSNLLHLDKADFTDLERGRFGYQHQQKWRQGTIFVMYNGKDGADDEMGVHVQITGTGCRDYEAHHNLMYLVQDLVMLDAACNFTRLDLAIDDLDESLIKFSQIHQAALDRHFTSRWNKWQEINTRQSQTGEFLGRTIYFGSQSSDIFCRLYDKTLERKAKGDADEQAEIPPHWTRLEIVYKKDRARNLARVIADESLTLGNALRATLNQYIRFVTPVDTDSNKARWPTAGWWLTFLAGVDKLVLTKKREPKSIEDMTDWVDRQIAPTIAAITKAREGEIDWLVKIINGGAGRLSQRHLDAIEQYLTNNERDE